MDSLLFDQTMSMYPADAPSIPTKHNRNHRRAATEGSFDFLFEQQKQEQKQRRVSSVDHDPFGLGPAAPAKPDLLNSIAHSFVKEQQQRMLDTGANFDPARTGLTTDGPRKDGPTLIHSESLSTRGSATPSQLDGQAPSPAPLVSPPAPPCPAPPAMVFASEDEMMDLAMTVQPIRARAQAHAPGPTPATSTASAMDMDMDYQEQNTGLKMPPKTIMPDPNRLVIQPLNATMETVGTEDGDRSGPSRLSRFLDSLQVVADQQNVMFQEQLMEQQRRLFQNDVNSTISVPRPQTVKGHRRAVSEGPAHLDLNFQQQRQHQRQHQQHYQHYQQQQNWPSFEMSDRTEEAAIFMANQNHGPSYY